MFDNILYILVKKRDKADKQKEKERARKNIYIYTLVKAAAIT